MANTDWKQGQKDQNTGKGPKNPSDFKTDTARKDYETGYKTPTPPKK